MSAQLLDGKALAATIKSDLSKRVSKLNSEGVFPGLATILVGEDPGSLSYVSEFNCHCQQGLVHRKY